MHFTRLSSRRRFCGQYSHTGFTRIPIQGWTLWTQDPVATRLKPPSQLEPAQLACKLKRASVRLCTGPHGVPVNMQFATNLLMEMAGAACTNFRHSRRLRPFPYAYACTFMILFGATQPATAATQQETTQETDKSRQSPERPVT